MVTILRRLTTEYVYTEDRIRIAGQTPEDGRVVIWLTNRLAVRLIPKLIQWLENQTTQSAAHSSSIATSAFPEVRRELQSFAQSAAVARLEPQQPITVASDGSGWVATTAGIKTTSSHLSLDFRAPEQSASVRFDATTLRQWLSILHRAWSTACWPSPIWPDWIERDQCVPRDAIRH